MMSKGTTSPEWAPQMTSRPSFDERVEAELEERAADVLVDEVDAAVVGEAHHLGDDVLGRVVDPVVHPELGGAGELLVGGGVADHGRSRHVRELDGGRADAAADRVDHHGLAGLEVAAREEHVPRGAEGDLHRGGLGVGELLGDAHQVPGRAGEPLRVAAGGAEADVVGVRAERLAAGAAEAALAAGRHQQRHHAVADLPALDALAELGDPADDLEAEDERRLDREARGALADVDVEVVERAGRDVDQHLARAGPRVGNVFEPKHVDSAELVEHDRLHAATSRIGKRPVYV